MSDLNRDIQASYHIISVLERSKMNTENVIDELPDLFMVIDQEGRVIKGNKRLSGIFAVNIENLLGLSLSGLFSEESWRVFKLYLKNLSEQNAEPSVEFELTIDGKPDQHIICYWTLAPMKVPGDNQNSFFTLVGRDITLLRMYQKQLAEIFASIPLGIFTVNRDGLVEDAFSVYTQWLLGKERIAGVSFRDLIYEPAKEAMDAAGREGFENLLAFSKYNVKEFDSLSDTFPRQVFFPLEKPDVSGNKGRYLGLKVQSISHGLQVNGLLVIIEDRTSIVEAEMADEKKRLLMDLSLDRAIQIKKCDPDLLDVVMNDLKTWFSNLGDAVMKKDQAQFKTTLHSIKGNARLAGFNGLIKLSHSAETNLSSSPFDWGRAFIETDGLRSEWRELQALAQIIAKKPDDMSLEGEGDAAEPEISILEEFLKLKASLKVASGSETLLVQFEDHLKRITQKPVTAMEPLIRTNVQKTAQLVNKKVKFLMSSERDFYLDEATLALVRASLIHLSNNSVDHGIESSEERLAQKKNLQGTIRLSVYIAGDHLVFQLDDDGGGINKEKVLRKAIDKNLVSRSEVAKMTDESIMALIFKPGFSTAHNVSEVSGRGEGLAAVVKNIESLGGAVKVIPGVLGGSSFQLFLPFKE